MTIRHLLLGASASLALSLAAGASLAQSASVGPDDVCLDEGCTMISLFGIPAATDYDETCPNLTR